MTADDYSETGSEQASINCSRKRTKAMGKSEESDLCGLPAQPAEERPAEERPCVDITDQTAQPESVQPEPAREDSACDDPAPSGTESADVERRLTFTAYAMLTESQSCPEAFASYNQSVRDEAFSRCRKYAADYFASLISEDSGSGFSFEVSGYEWSLSDEQPDEHPDASGPSCSGQHQVRYSASVLCVITYSTSEKI